MQTNDIKANEPMEQLLQRFPGAKRTLFAAYHIGGCQSCAYQNDETLEQVCKRNELKIEEVISRIQESHKADQEMLISCEELALKIQNNEGILIVDTRTREEHDAVCIPSSVFLTESLQNELFSKKDQKQTIILYDHLGKQVLDTCAWFRGHDLNNSYALLGGIDTYSKIIDPTLSRYRIEME